MTKQAAQAPLTLLLDANNLVCRVYYATERNMVCQHAKRADSSPLFYRDYKEDFPENLDMQLLYQKVCFYVCCNVQHIIIKHRPHYILAAADDEYNFKKELNEGYKKKHSEKSELLRQIIAEIPMLMRQLGIISVGAYGYEADDVIATLVARAPGKVLISTQDHDLYALLSPEVSILGKSGKILRETGFIKLYGILPAQLPFLKALTGDSSDHMPAVPYFRRNRQLAAQLVGTFKTPAALFAHLQRLPSPVAQSLASVGQSVIEQRTQIHTLCKQVPLQEL